MTLFTLWIWLFSFITHRFIQTCSWKWACVGKCTTWCTMHKIWEHIKGHIIHFMCHVFRAGQKWPMCDFKHETYNLWNGPYRSICSCLQSMNRFFNKASESKTGAIITFFTLAVTSTNELWDPRSWDCHPHPQAPGCHLSRQYTLYCPCSPATQEERKRC